MAKKIVIINCSPRLNRNTATLLKEAQRGAESVSAEVEYIDLVKLNIKGCMSCMACKLTGNKCGGLCAWKDDLRPVLQSIHEADALIIGSPIYWSYPTGMFRNLIERLLFPILCYNASGKPLEPSKYIDKQLKVGLIYTMNVTPELYEHFGLDAVLAPDYRSLKMFFGHCEVLNAYGTWQFYPDYSKYDANGFDMDQKQWYRDNQWPKDREAAFELGKRLVE